MSPQYYGGGGMNPPLDIPAPGSDSRPFIPVYASDYNAIGDGITDDLNALTRAIANTPIGGELILNNNANYRLSAQLVIDRSIKITGNSKHLKGSNETVGTVFSLSPIVNQANLQSLVLLNASEIEINGIFVQGLGYLLGSIGYYAGSNAWNCTLKNSGGTGFGGWLKLGAGSNHLKAYDCRAFNNLDAIVFGVGNGFDYTFYTCSFDGNIRSAAFLEKEAGTENVTFIHTALGFSQYGILQDPTTVANLGFSGLTLLDCGLEQVTVAHIQMLWGGNIHVQGGYWTWTAGASSTQPAFKINNVSYGPIYFNPKLEPIYPNLISPALISISGFTNHPIYIDCALNNFAASFVNWGPSVRADRVWVNGIRFGSEGFTNDLDITGTAADQDIVIVQPPGAAGTKTNYVVRAFVRVTATTDLRLTLTYNNGASPRTIDILPTTSLIVGDYSYTFYIRAATFNVVKLVSRISIASAAKVSAAITGEL